MSDNIITRMFRASENAFQKAAQLFGRTEKELDEDVETIKNWLKTQPHLPEIMEDIKIKNFLLLNKCSVEKTKPKIDMFYTIRTLIPDFFENCNPKLPVMRNLMETAYCVTLPKPVDDLYRVFFFKLREVNSLQPRETITHMFNMAQIRLCEDCLVGEIYIFDFNKLSINDISKLTPTFLAKVFAAHEKVYSLRIKALYFINSPTYIDKLLSFLKIILKAKIFNRIRVCQDATILHDILDKDVVPRDYGGEGPSLHELNERLKVKFAEYQNLFDKLDTQRVNESLRPEKLCNDDILGYYGNFKKIDVD